MKQELAAKLDRIRSFMSQNGFHGVLLSRNQNFSWLSCGHYAFVNKSAERGVAQLLILEDRQLVLCNSSERYRIPEEELRELDFELVWWYWNESPEQQLSEYLSGKRIATDFPGGPMVDCTAELAALRAPLTEGELLRYQEIGPEAAAITQAVARAIRPGQTEYQVAARLTGALMEAGYQVPVCLVGSDQRLMEYRHPLPTARVVEKRCMVAVCAQKYGLTASLSRMVCFAPLSQDIREKHRAVTTIDAAYILSTQPGAVTGEIIQAGKALYEELGYGSDFYLHHQGGALGYATRDYCATEASRQLVLAGQTFGWNPTISGVKSEDTILALPQGPQVLTTAESWPQLTVKWQGQTTLRPDILVL